MTEQKEIKDARKCEHYGLLAYKLGNIIYCDAIKCPYGMQKSAVFELETHRVCIAHRLEDKIETSAE